MLFIMPLFVVNWPFDHLSSQGLLFRWYRFALFLFVTLSIPSRNHCQAFCFEIHFHPCVSRVELVTISFPQLRKSRCFFDTFQDDFHTISYQLNMGTHTKRLNGDELLIFCVIIRGTFYHLIECSPF